MGIGIRPDEKDDAAIEDRKITDDPQHGLLLRADDVRRANKFCGAPELGMHASGCHLCGGFPAAHQSPCVSIRSCPGFNRQRFACKHRLIEQDRPIDQVHIGSNHPAERQLHQIATHQLRRRYRLPSSVTPDGSIQGEPRLQGKESGLGAAFLEVGQSCIEDQETGDDRGLEDTLCSTT